MKISADYRALAQDALQGRWKTAVLTGIAASALGASIVNSITSSASNISQNSDLTRQDYAVLFAQPTGGRLLLFLVVCSVLWSIFTFIVRGGVRLGYARFNLNLVDKADARFSDLFSQKGRLWDGFCLNFFQQLYVALWSLLLVVPGIVKSYSYAMAPYVMAEHPALTANEAITESRRIMDGNKWRLFCLDLSFLGWELLCSVPMFVGFYLIVVNFSATEALGVALIMLFTVPLSIGFFFLRPYEEAAWAVFYRDITAPSAAPEENF